MRKGSAGASPAASGATPLASEVAILIELRYATARNVTGKPIYPPNARCLVRRSTAERLKQAQAELQAQKLGDRGQAIMALS